MEIRLDRKSQTPIHLQIAHQIKERILKGALPEGGRLPPTRKMARALGVNRSTVVQAYENLWAEGLVESHVGRGTTVRSAEQGRSSPVSSPPWSMLFAPRAENIEMQVRDLSRLLDREGLISLAAGLPAPDLYPIEETRALTREIIETEGRSLLHWCNLEGYGPLRQALAERLQGVAAREVIVLSGSTQGIFLLARIFLEPGDFVALEVPTYLGAIHAFKAAGARIIGIPVDDDGMDLDMLENALSRTPPKFIYTIPTFQNPTGATLTLEKRKRLLDLAYRHGIPIVEDDPYRDLRYEGDEVPPLKNLDTHGFVIYLSTFTKTLFPGLRVGWMAAPRRVIDQITPAKHMLDLFTNGLAQAVVHRFIAGGRLAKHLDRVRTEYRERRDAMVEALRRHAPGLSYDVPQGGYFIWCRLPREVPARELLRETLKRKVSFFTGDVFHPDGSGRDRIRLTFTCQPPEVIDEAVRRLGRTLRRLRKRGAVPADELEASIRPVV